MADMELDPSIAADPQLIRELWYNEAAGLREARSLLRIVMDSDRRAELVDRVAQHFEHSDALLDAYGRLGALAVDNV